MIILIFSNFKRKSNQFSKKNFYPKSIKKHNIRLFLLLYQKKEYIQI